MSGVNFRVATQARAYQEGVHDGMALLITALEEGGTVNNLLEVLEWNARPEDAKRLNDFYAARAGEVPPV